MLAPISSKISGRDGRITPPWATYFSELTTGGGSSWGSITGALSDQTDLNTALSAKAAASHSHSISNVTGLQTALDAKQATLVSATNIKTVNGSSLLGSGDLVISANLDGGSAASVYGGSSTIDGGGA